MRKTGTKWPFLSALHSTSSLSVYFRVRPRLSKHGLWYGSTESNSGEYLCRLIPCLQTFTILSFFYIHLIDSSSSTFGRKFNFSPCKQAWKTKTGFLRGKGCTSDQTFWVRVSFVFIQLFFREVCILWVWFKNFRTIEATESLVFRNRELKLAGNRN